MNIYKLLSIFINNERSCLTNYNKQLRVCHTLRYREVRGMVSFAENWLHMQNSRQRIYKYSLFIYLFVKTVVRRIN